MKEINQLVECAVAGDSAALEQIIVDIKDYIFHLSLRMLGSVCDADDATQEILIRIITKLSSFRGDANFHTWVYRITVNYLLDYKKSMFAQHPLDFEFYANDIKAGYVEDMDRILDDMDQDQLAEELKLSCTNVMLQCLDPQSRCIFILGTMFKINSKMAGEILDITPENYRQKLSRARQKMAKFLAAYCGHAGGMCNCKKRLSYAIQQHRLQPDHLEYTALPRLHPHLLKEYTKTMNDIELEMNVFENQGMYGTKLDTREFIMNLLQSDSMMKMKNYCEV